MFEVTDRAAAALAEKHARNGSGERTAIRISASKPNGAGSPAGYQLRFASHALPNDIVVEQDSTSVFLAPGVSERLGESVLDVVDTETGPRLVLKHRPTA